MPQNIKRKLFIIILIITGISYIYSMRLAIWSLALFTIIGLLQIKDIHHIKFNKNYLGILLFFVLLALGGLYTGNTDRYFEIIQRFLGFLLVPIIFMIGTPLEKKEKQQFIKIFVYAVLIFHLLNFIYALYRQIEISITKNASIDWYLFYRFDYVSLFSQHPTYVAMFSIMALTYLLFDEKELGFKPSKRIFLTAFLTFSLLLNGSRQGYALMMMTYFIYLIVLLKNSTHKFRIILIFLSGLALIITIAFKIPIIKERIYVTFGKKQYYKYYFKKNYDSENNPEKQGRLLIWQDAFEVIKKSPFIGLGTGSDEQALQAQYLKNKHTYLVQKGYNAHNSYIQWLLNGGIVLLAAYLFLLGQILFFSIRHKDVISFVFFMIIFSVSFTETMYRIQGIIFIAFFYSFLLISNKKPEHT